MTAPASQPGILAAVPPCGLSLTFRLALEADPRPALARLREGFDPERGVIGFGEPLVRALGATVPGLRVFPSLSGPACSVPSTQAALWLLLRGEARGALFDAGERLKALLVPAFVLEDAMDTFLYDGGRDLTGYEDGTENPKDAAAIEAALAADGASFVAVQRWVHDLAHFNAHSPAERDAMIGRRRADNKELDDAPASAHVKRSAQESFEPPAFMLRRSMPWATAHEQGLEFIAFGHSPDAFEQVMRRMAGQEDGGGDALFTFSRPLTGGYYWCPPVKAGRLDLSLILP
ncbi:MAG: Dyp-type peroxidase [Rhodocyclales bacterium]|nr:Dyp-type peroxidase [Rhodocyclales bacterium]